MHEARSAELVKSVLPRCVLRGMNDVDVVVTTGSIEIFSQIARALGLAATSVVERDPTDSVATLGLGHLETTRARAVELANNPETDAFTNIVRWVS